MRTYLNAMGWLVCGACALWLETRGEGEFAEVSIDLPAYEVKAGQELPEPETWRYFQVGAMEVISSASEQESRHWIRELLRLQQVFHVLLPANQPEETAALSVILCRKRSQFTEFMPAGWRSRQEAGEVIPSLFFRKGEIAAIVIDLETRVINLVTADTLIRMGDEREREDFNSEGWSNADIAIESQRLLLREYTRFVLSTASGRAPAWLEEGVAQLLMGMRVRKDAIVLGKLAETTPLVVIPSWLRALMGGREPRPDQLAAREFDREERKLKGPQVHDFNHALMYRHLMPWEEFFAVSHESRRTLSPAGGLWAKQAQAWVHLCLFGRGQRYKDGLIQFVSRLRQEPVSERLFTECFGVSYREMTALLYAYIDHTKYRYFTFKSKSGDLPVPQIAEVRLATEAESGRIKGAALRLGDNIEAARRSVQVPYARGSRDALLLAEIGLVEHALGEEQRARRFIEAAVREEVRRPRAYLELAHWRFRDALVQAEEGKLESRQVVGILRPLFTARRQHPPLPEVYHLIADTWERSRVPPTAANLAVLIEGANLFPEDSELIFKSARMYRAHGLHQVADDLVRLGVETARDEETKGRFRAL